MTPPPKKNMDFGSDRSEIAVYVFNRPISGGVVQSFWLRDEKFEKYDRERSACASSSDRNLVRRCFAAMRWGKVGN